MVDQAHCLEISEIRKVVKARSFGDLEPGLQAALDLLDREIRNESIASDLADARDDTCEATLHAQQARAYRLARDLLQEQMSKLARKVG